MPSCLASVAAAGSRSCERRRRRLLRLLLPLPCQLRSIVGHTPALARGREKLDQHFVQHGARLGALAVDHEHEAAALLGQQRHGRIHARQRSGVRDAQHAVDIRQSPAVAIGIEATAVPARCRCRQRHRHVRRPQRLALRRRQPCSPTVRIQPHAHPLQHVVEAAADAARGGRGADRDRSRRRLRMTTLLSPSRM